MGIIISLELNQMISEDKNYIEELFKFDDSQLFDIYTRELEEYAAADWRVPLYGVRLPPYGVGLRGVAEKLLRQIKDSLRDRVCTNDSFMDLWKSDRAYDRVVLAAAIADLLVSLIFGIAPAVVAVLIVKEGIASLCP